MFSFLCHVFRDPGFMYTDEISDLQALSKGKHEHESFTYT
jgi:hypothetical protein